jgi:membrane-associated phospholipid phosphatase
MALSACGCACAQNELPNAPQPQSSVTVRNVPRLILGDQRAIWTSPAHLRLDDLEWLVPLAAVTSLAVATDRDAMRHVVPIDANLNKKSTDASNILLGGVLATPVALFGFGQIANSPHAREAGLLSGEAAVDAVAVEQGLKLVFWRERPFTNNASGDFFKSGAGFSSSFPSTHSTVAWSTAAVLAGEYPTFWPRLFIYGAATGVSAARVMGQQHFPSDVIVGSTAGWLVGHYVFRKHHNKKLMNLGEY